MAKKSKPVGSVGTPATVAAASAGVAYTLHSYLRDRSASSYGVEAAEALGVDAGRVFKTLVVKTDNGLAVGVVPVDSTLSLKSIAAALGCKRAEMADPGSATRATGYVLGGISPLGQKSLLPHVVDESVLSYETVFVSAGRRGLEIELAPDDLVGLTNATLAAIAA
jgi:Cys-tRNA(Pro)/Cys-tRNA(Cys) deacylase